MNNLRTVFTVILAVTTMLVFPAAAQQAATTNQTTSVMSAAAEAEYTAKIEGRAAAILQALELKDEAKAAHVRDALLAQYRRLRAWHDANDARLKSLTNTATGRDTDSATSLQARAEIEAIKVTLKSIHAQFLSALAPDLTPTQIDQVKDQMTYGKVKVTLDAYLEIIPGLTARHRERMLELLKEAREEAMDCGSAEEKSAVFKIYKGKINNYLSAEGFDVGKAYKDWGAKQKSKTAKPPQAP